MIKKIPREFKEFVKGISKKDRVGIIFDGDPDGLCSGVIIFHAIQQIREKKPELIFTQGKQNPFLNETTVEKIVEKKINKLICVDISIDQNPRGIKLVERVVEKFLIIDHHKKYNNVNSSKTFMIKAGEVSKLDGAKYPCSKFSYDLFSQYTDLTKFDWVSSIGILGDNGLNQWREFVLKSVEKISSSLNELVKVKDLITAIESMNWIELNELVFELIKAKKPSEILELKYVEKAKEFETEVKKVLKEFEEKKQEKKDLILFEFKSKLRLKGEIANIVSNKQPHKTIIIMQIQKNQVLISARRQDYKIKMNDLIENTIKGFENASGGGHIPAAAAKIQLKDLNEFKKRIKKELKIN